MMKVEKPTGAKVKKYLIALSISLLTVSWAYAQEHRDRAVTSGDYSPYVNDDYPKDVYFGDLHLHSSYSVDAGLVGNTLSPEDAYRFASGEQVITSSGQPAKLIRPLDFLMVADHGTNLGLPPMLWAADPDLLATEYGKKWYDLDQAGKGKEAYLEWIQYAMDGKDLINSEKIMSSAWSGEIDAAEAYNNPGVFTALIGYEWTSMPDASNLHRVVVFKDGRDKVGQILPFTAFDSVDPEDLWQFMAGYEDKTAGEVLAIPHNGNMSNGQMFSVERRNGEPIDEQYAIDRMRWEPLYEVTQIKGDGEAHPKLSTTDEFADYGTWDVNPFVGEKDDDMLQYEYARTALQVGLQQQQKLGVNPFKFGMIGSTDAHTGLATTREENYWGKFPSSEPHATRYEEVLIPSPIKEEYDLMTWQEVGSGLTAVWAEDNTREALFDAMQRKETYATTGTRIKVRFFAGWDYQTADTTRPEFAAHAYSHGVPMGGDLSSAPKGEAPKFLIQAVKDPDGANLDRVQVIKGWVDDKGERHEKIYDVAVSGGRKIGRDGRARTPVGSTVNVTEATYRNSIGDSQLVAHWADPDFNASQSAVYYVRVLEIPTPTWQAYDSNHYEVEMPEEVPMTHQERAYTSPIWYTP
jgi:hypothetical protein